jgi:hypothetical protein
MIQQQLQQLNLNLDLDHLHLPVKESLQVYFPDQDPANAPCIVILDSSATEPLVYVKHALLDVYIAMPICIETKLLASTANHGQF